MAICSTVFIQFRDSSDFVSDSIATNANSSATKNATTTTTIVVQHHDNDRLVLAYCNGSHLPFQTSPFHLRPTFIQRCTRHDTTAFIHVSLRLLRCVGMGMRGIFVGGLHQNERVAIRARFAVAAASEESISIRDGTSPIHLCIGAASSRLAIFIHPSN
mmetsp:Transcript_11173/g.23774  ORF Transcript_11173/g.23774 Transcript_11173/m.23774 type:complete len:159 (+) Transcript_11173:382-858(+)